MGRIIRLPLHLPLLLLFFLPPPPLSSLLLLFLRPPLPPPPPPSITIFVAEGVIKNLVDEFFFVNLYISKFIMLQFLCEFKVHHRAWNQQKNTGTLASNQADLVPPYFGEIDRNLISFGKFSFV